MTFPLDDTLLLAARYYEAGQLELAEQLCQQALQNDPCHVNAVHLQGLIAFAQGKHAQALDCLRHVVQIQPELAEAHNNLGIFLLQMGELGTAVPAFEKALRLQPGYAEAHNNLGTTLLRQGKDREALVSFQQAVRYKPDYAEAHYSLGMLHLLHGDFQGGWPEYEWRWRTRRYDDWLWQKQSHDLRLAPQPLWDGSSLNGRTILLQAEQGLGDTLQFIRYAGLVKERGGHVIVEAAPVLASLLRTCPGVASVITDEQPLPPFDVHASLLSLPGLFGTTLATVPADIPYLAADAGLAARWRQELAATAQFKVGIVWQGSRLHEQDRYRSAPLREFAPLAAVPNVRLFSLQVGSGHEQLQALNGQFPVTDLGKRFDPASFVDAAAVIENLDLVVTVDTALAHLAGALGKPVWMALPVCPDWRWLLEREDSPWYPSMRLFRQRELGHWDDVFARIAMELSSLAGRERNVSDRRSKRPDCSGC